jgi:hypothetical protein
LNAHSEPVSSRGFLMAQGGGRGNGGARFDPVAAIVGLARTLSQIKKSDYGRSMRMRGPALD